MRIKEMLAIFIFSISIFLQNSALALDCPKYPEQISKDWEVEVNAAIAKIGPVTGSELQTRTRNATQDLLERLPDAGSIYLEQMMYAAYCSGLRDDKSLSETEKGQRVRSYNSEVRNTISGQSSVQPPSKKEALKGEKPSVSSSKKASNIYQSPPLPKAKDVFENDVLRVEVVSFQEFGSYFNLALKHINRARQPIRVRCPDHRKNTFLIDNHDVQYYYMTPYEAGRDHELSMPDRGMTVELVPNVPRIISFQFARSTESSGVFFTFSSKYEYGISENLPHNPIYVIIENIKLDQ